MGSLHLCRPVHSIVFSFGSASPDMMMMPWPVLPRGGYASSRLLARPIKASVFTMASTAAGGGALMKENSLPHVDMQPNNRVYFVGDFMTRKDNLHVVKPTTTVDEALEILVENRITGFPVIDDDWKLVGLVSDYDLLALGSVSGSGRNDTSVFPEVDRSWKTFNEVQKLLGKTNGRVVDDVMTPTPLVVLETTNLEDAARSLLETKYHQLPVVDGAGKLVGIITRGNVVRAALQTKRSLQKKTQP